MKTTTMALVAACLILMFLLSLQSPTSSTPTPTPTPAPRYTLRNWSKTVLPEHAQEEFGLTTRKRDWGETDTAPRLYIDNQFEDQGDVIVDYATGLMWQKFGSTDTMTHTRAKQYVTRLNHQKFAGYDDWRLPTVPELMSLLEPEVSSTGFFIAPQFKVLHDRFYSVWSADLRDSSGTTWFVDFGLGGVYWFPANGMNLIRVVRP